CRGAKQLGSIEYLQRVIRSGGPVQDHRAGVGNAIRQHTTVGRERGDKWDCLARWRSRPDIVRYCDVARPIVENLFVGGISYMARVVVIDGIARDSGVI